MTGDPIFRKSIYASIIAAIVTILFIQPILTLFGKVLIWLGANVYEGISSSIYRQAAQGFNELPAFMTLCILMGGVTSIIAIEVVFRLIPRRATGKLKEHKIVKGKYVPLILITVGVVCAGFVLAGNYASLQLNTSFNQRLAVLATKISDIECKAVRANWALMQNRKDYELIIQQMEKLAVERNVKLPNLLWK